MLQGSFEKEDPSNEIKKFNSRFAKYARSFLSPILKDTIENARFELIERGGEHVNTDFLSNFPLDLQGSVTDIMLLCSSFMIPELDPVLMVDELISSAEEDALTLFNDKNSSVFNSSLKSKNRKLSEAEAAAAAAEFEAKAKETAVYDSVLQDNCIQLILSLCIEEQLDTFDKLIEACLSVVMAHDALFQELKSKLALRHAGTHTDCQIVALTLKKAKLCPQISALSSELDNQLVELTILLSELDGLITNLNVLAAELLAFQRDKTASISNKRSQSAKKPLNFEPKESFQDVFYSLVALQTEEVGQLDHEALKRDFMHFMMEKGTKRCFEYFPSLKVKLLPHLEAIIAANIDDLEEKTYCAIFNLLFEQMECSIVHCGA